MWKRSRKVKVIAPAGIVKKEEFEKGIEILKEYFGLDPIFGERIFERHEFFSGSESSRSRELLEALASDYPLIWVARGGYGSLSLLPYLKSASVTGQKTILGFSDITALLLHKPLLANSSLKKIYAPNICFLPKLTSRALEHLRRLLFEGGRFELEGVGVKDGVSEAELVRGNLSTLISTLGTPYFPELSKKILFLEDTNERPYRIHRMLLQLKLSGHLEKVEALVVGDLCGLSVEKTYEILKSCGLLEKFPLAIGFNFGHISDFFSIPIGIRARVEVKGDAARLLFTLPPSTETSRRLDRCVLS